MSQLNIYQPHWVREDFIDFIGEKINPMWALKKIKARLMVKEHLSDDFIQLELRPNQHFNYSRYQAGQSIAIQVRVAGVLEQRHYSILKILDNGDLIVAVKVQGKVSQHLADLAVHSIVEISQAQGEFVLKASPNPIVLLASGSGITAIYALLKQALKVQMPQIDLIYFSRDSAYHAEFKSLALTYNGFNYHGINTLEQQQHLDVELLERLVPHFKLSDSYACGAAAMLKSVHEIYTEHGIAQRLSTEYFQKAVDEHLPSQPVKFIRSQQDFIANSNLLSSAEQAGLKPKHGCRLGICNSCSCTKISGSVKNLLTGDIDHANNSQIKLCISQAISPVEINL